MTEPARTYSSMPKAARRTWMVPRWLKEAFLAFAVIAIAVVGVSKALQHFGGKVNRAAGALDADELRIAPAPAFSLPDRDGKPVDLSTYRGKVVLLNFWATWCPPCREEEPSLRQLAKAMDPRKFQLVAVSVDETGWPAIDKFFSGNRPPYAVALIELAEGVRMISDVVGVPYDKVRIGMPVRLAFQVYDEELVLPVFRAREEETV